MPQRREGLLDDGPVGHWGFMEPVVPADPGKSWSALQISCPACGADVGVYCPGDRFCPARMAQLRELARSGQLAGDEIRAQVRACPGCRKKRNQNNVCNQTHWPIPLQWSCR
jgi:hypothetical protein